MKQILVQFDEATVRMLDEVAPGSARMRSKFIRQAVIKALMEVAEEHTRRAYEKQPDDDREEWFDPACWAPEAEAIHPPKPLKRSKQPRAKRRRRTRR